MGDQDNDQTKDQDQTKDKTKDQNGDGHDTTGDKDMIPRARLNQEIEKRKDMEKELKEVAEELKSDVPDKFKDLIPDLPPKALIQWLRKANREGLFVEGDPDSTNKDKDTDSKKPGSQKQEDLANLSPYAKMERGYKTK